MEDLVDARGCVERLVRSMYATRDASNVWQKDHTTLLASHEVDPTQRCHSVKELDARLSVPGDDFVVFGDATAVDTLLKTQ